MFTRAVVTLILAPLHIGSSGVWQSITGVTTLQVMWFLVQYIDQLMTPALLKPFPMQNVFSTNVVWACLPGQSDSCFPMNPYVQWWLCSQLSLSHTSTNIKIKFTTKMENVCAFAMHMDRLCTRQKRSEWVNELFLQFPFEFLSHLNWTDRQLLPREWMAGSS